MKPKKTKYDYDYKRLVIYYTPSQYQEINDAAENMGLKISQLCRIAIYKHIKILKNAGIDKKVNG